MKVYLKRTRSNVEAEGDFNPKTKSLKVFRGAKLSEDVSYTETFRAAKTIEKYREGNVIDCVLQKDMLFKSASTAANFVTGRSTNGLKEWKTKNGQTIKQYLSSLGVN